MPPKFTVVVASPFCKTVRVIFPVTRLAMVQSTLQPTVDVNDPADEALYVTETLPLPS